jgi:molybdenum cofactor cytidylyltransferase
MKKQPGEKYGMVILAGGASLRMGGRPKQMIVYGDKTLLKNAVDEANAAVNNRVMVVTGANYELLEVELSQLPVHVIYNDNWQQGMATSIQCGLASLLKIYPDLDAVIFSVCDQPFISSALFKQLIEKHWQGKNSIIASYYSGTAGVPVLFGSQYFQELLNLKGNQGAKVLLGRFANDVATVPFPNGNIDIDTVDDINKLLNIED